MPIVLVRGHQCFGDEVENEKAEREAERDRNCGHDMIGALGRVVHASEHRAEHERDARADAERQRIGGEEEVLIGHEARREERERAQSEADGERRAEADALGREHING